MDIELIRWAKRVKDRDSNKCVICGSERRPNAHHLIPKELKETRYNIDNGITLCPKHHRFSRRISAHQNPIAFVMWLELNRHTQLEYVKYKIRRMAEECSEC